MPSSPASSSASSACRIDWRPSRWLALALIALGAMGATAIWLSALAPTLKPAVALLALMQGLRLAKQEASLPSRVFAWPGGDAPATLESRQGRVNLVDVAVLLRGPLATLTGRDPDGKTHRLVWWPDTLPALARRQLRLAAAVSRRSDKTPPQLAA